MGLFDFIKGEFIEVIEWTDDARDTLVWRFPVRDHAIKMGAQLTVREGQMAVFLNEGQLADVFEPGRHQLTTANLPILTKLRSWSHGFTSPFKADVVFVNTRQFLQQRWGTPNPIMLRDPELGPVRLRAFGTYGFRVSDAGKFLQEIVGTSGELTTDDVDDQLRSHVVQGFTHALGAAGVPALDLATRYKLLGQELLPGVQAEVDAYGLKLTTFVIENISLPKEVEEFLDKRTSMGVVGDMGRFAAFQAANAMEKAAAAPGGAAGAGVGLGAGVAMGQMMAQAMAPTAAPAAPAAAAPAAADPAARLAKLKGLLDAGLITAEDFEQRKAAILAEI